MSASEKTKPTPQTDTAATQVVERLQGRVDALDNGRVFGWVWHPGHPEQRVEVTLMAGEDAVLTATADKARIDLRRNGIGDGRHAFEISVPDQLLGEAQASLKVVAIHPETGAVQDLAIPTVEQRSIEMAASTPFNAIMDRMDILIALQREAHRDRLKALKAAEEAPAMSEEGLTLDALRAEQETMTAQIRELEVCLVRLDGTLAGLSGTMSNLAERDRHSVRPHLMLLALGTGFIAGVAACAGMGL
jgi:hypothetical protein